MAIQEGPIFREGVTINGIIYYKSRGQYLLRAAPGKGGVKQTQETKRSSQSFGVASAAAKLLYRSFQPVIPAFLNNWTMQNRVRAVMRRVVGKENSAENSALWSYDWLEQFAFNDQAIFPPLIRDENICRVTGKNSVLVSMPKLYIKHVSAPKSSCYLSFRLMAVVFDFRRNKQRADELVEMHYDCQDLEIPSKELMFHFSKKIKPGNVIIVALQISFFNGKNKLISTVKTREFEASGIIGVFPIASR
jgi:hypothetical protein